MEKHQQKYNHKMKNQKQSKSMKKIEVSVNVAAEK